MATMLEEVGGRVPTNEELVLVHGELETEPVEYLSMSLSRAAEEDDVRLTVEQAWHLTDFADGVRATAHLLTKSADEIEHAVQTIYNNHRGESDA